MLGLDTWMAARGFPVAVALEESAGTICESATARFAEHFETLLLDLPRPDAPAFQRLAFEETPRRLHRLLQVALRFQTVAVVEREYRWSWVILPRYGITLRHMHAMIRAYFEATRAVLTLDQSDRHFLEIFERSVLDAVERSAPLETLRVHQPYQSYGGNGRRSNKYSRQ